MTTTTANAVRVMQHLEFCQQCLWPELDVQMVSVTEQWAQFAVAGPRARDVLQAVVDPAYDLSNAAFPYLAAATSRSAAARRARLFRLSFSGELAYEIAVPARFGEALMRAILEAGAPFGIAPYGTEALGVLRIEKGHPAGSELNGQTTAHDLGLGKMVSAKKDFIGRFMAARPALTDPARPSLVGLRPVDREDGLRAGAHFIPKDAAAAAKNDQGYVTSVAFSPIARPLARPRPPLPRPRAPRRDRARLRSGARRRRPGRGPSALLHRSGRGAPPCLTGLSVRSRRLPASPFPAASARPGGEPGVLISERVGLGLATVACRKGQASALKAAVAERLWRRPSRQLARRARTGGGLHRQRTGPMACRVGKPRQRGARPRSRAQSCKASPRSPTRAAARTVLRVSGPRARDVLAKGLPIDLDPRAFPLGSAATSVISLMGVQLWQVDDTRSYDIAVFRSLSAKLLALAHRVGRRVRLRGHRPLTARMPGRAATFGLRRPRFFSESFPSFDHVRINSSDTSKCIVS